MIKELVKLANHLDAKGLKKEADALDSFIQKVASEENSSPYKVYHSLNNQAEDLKRFLYFLQRYTISISKPSLFLITLKEDLAKLPDKHQVIWDEVLEKISPERMGPKAKESFFEILNKIIYNIDTIQALLYSFVYKPSYTIFNMEKTLSKIKDFLDDTNNLGSENFKSTGLSKELKDYSDKVYILLKDVAKEIISELQLEEHLFDPYYYELSETPEG